jgi:hypothetical protein
MLFLIALFALVACGLLGFAFLWYRESSAKNRSPVIIEDNVDMCLRGIGGEALGMYHPMMDADIIRIGKAVPNHLILGKLMCMNQAIIQYRDSSYWIDDAGSLGGTYLNGERVLTAQPLIKQSEVRFNIHDAPGSVAYIFQFCKNDSRTASS